MPMMWKKIVIAPGVSVQAAPLSTRIRSELPVIEEIIASLPNLATVGLRLVTPKQQIFPSTKFEGDGFIFGSSAQVQWRENTQIDGPPYDLLLEYFNEDAASQTIQIGISFSDDLRNDTDILQDIAETLHSIADNQLIK